MYFPVLEKLKEYNISIEYIKLLDNILFLIYDKGYHQRFNPGVYKYFGIPVNESEWLSSLEKLRSCGLLQINFELTCPYCDETIEIYDDYDKLPFDQSKNCPSCGETFKVSEKDIFITYKFTENLKQSYKGTKETPFFPEISKEETKYSIEYLKQYPEMVYDTVLNGRKTELINLLNSIDSGYKINNREKGDNLENLTENLLKSPYLNLLSKDERTSTGEIDLIFEVKKYEGTIFQDFSNILIVECKNWEKKVGANEIRTFADKMHDTRANVGIFLSKSGVTGKSDFEKEAKGVIRDKWKTENIIIIVLTYDDIKNVVYGKKNLYELLKEKYYEVKLI